MFISIKYKIFFAQFIFVILLVSGLSYRFYSSQIEAYTNSLVDFYTNSTSWILSRVSLAISGDNYANVQLEDFVEYVSQNENLLFFKAYGKTDISSNDYDVMYDKKLKKIYRTQYKTEHMQELEKKIVNFESMLDDKSKDSVKINFLLHRLHAAKQEYILAQKYMAEVEKKYLDLLEHDGIFLDYENSLLLLELKTSNTNGGLVKFIFDISQIKSIKNETIKNILFESFLVLVFSLLVLWFVSLKLIKPLKNLSEYISKDFHEIHSQSVPYVHNNDEIGVLAKSFHAMLFQMNSYITRLEDLSKNDPLTGLFNRRAFDEIFSNMLKKNKTKYIALLYIDIDNFKKYNDHYGHNLGDVTLQKVSQSLKDSLQRKSDYAFRLGGEEFAVMLSADTKEDAIEIAQRIRTNILDLGVEHISNGTLNIVSISIGVFIAQNNNELQLIDLLNKADEALYEAKANGRNRVVTKVQN